MGFEEGGESRIYINPGPDKVSQHWQYVKLSSPDVEVAVLVDLDGNADIVISFEEEGKVAFISYEEYTTQGKYSVIWESFQEYFEDVDNEIGKMFAGNRYVATFMVVAFAVFLLTLGEFSTLWPIFGSANQMLAAMVLLAVAVWLIKGKVNSTFVLVPMFFMFAVTLSSLFLFSVQNKNFILILFIPSSSIENLTKKRIIKSPWGHISP
jgi:hypothetical protein